MHLNVGHGTLGWTLSVASGKLCALLVDRVADARPASEFIASERVPASDYSSPFYPSLPSEANAPNASSFPNYFSPARFSDAKSSLLRLMFRSEN